MKGKFQLKYQPGCSFLILKGTQALPKGQLENLPAAWFLLHSRFEITNHGGGKQMNGS